MKTTQLHNTEIKSPSGNRFYIALESLTVGRTTVINGKVVTRWTADKFEIGTWGKSTISINAAVDVLHGLY